MGEKVSQMFGVNVPVKRYNEEEEEEEDGVERTLVRALTTF